MPIQTRFHDYTDGSIALRACLAWDDTITQPRPGVLVSHAWRGRSEFEDQKAHELAALGYLGFALDMYGVGKLGTSPEQNRSMMQPLIDDREVLQRRISSALTELRGLPEVDSARTAAIGYCFGGLCVLDLARSGADINGVVSMHGLLGAPMNSATHDISAKVLIQHGWDDPMATPQDVLFITQELSARKADWQLHAFGNTLHAFTNPVAADPANGLLFDADADRRSWRGLQDFLQEVLD
ncbi:MAG: dienelactone hydrolase family protein [Woeseia sp.]